MVTKEHMQLIAYTFLQRRLKNEIKIPCNNKIIAFVFKFIDTHSYLRLISRVTYLGPSLSEQSVSSDSSPLSCSSNCRGDESILTCCLLRKGSGPLWGLSEIWYDVSYKGKHSDTDLLLSGSATCFPGLIHRTVSNFLSFPEMRPYFFMLVFLDSS